MKQRTVKRPTDWCEGRRFRAWELAQQGWKPTDIAAALGVTQGAVSQWLTRARARMRGVGLGGRGVAHARRRSVREAWLDQALMVHAWQRQRVLQADPSPSILPGRVPPECRASATRSRPGIRAVMRTVPCAVELCSAASCMTSIVRPRSTVCCHVGGVSAHVRLTIILPIRTHHNRFPDVE